MGQHQGDPSITRSGPRHRKPTRAERLRAKVVDSVLLKAATLVLLVSMLSVDPVLNDRA